jgi:hypothetical protein
MVRCGRKYKIFIAKGLICFWHSGILFVEPKQDKQCQRRQFDGLGREASPFLTLLEALKLPCQACAAGLTGEGQRAYPKIHKRRGAAFAQVKSPKGMRAFSVFVSSKGEQTCVAFSAP